MKDSKPLKLESCHSRMLASSTSSLELNTPPSAVEAGAADSLAASALRRRRRRRQQDP